MGRAAVHVRSIAHGSGWRGVCGVVVAAALTFACSETTSAPATVADAGIDADASLPLTLDTWVETFTRTMCEKSIGLRARGHAPYATTEGCIASVKTQRGYVDFVGRVDRARAGDGIVFDAAKASACLGSATPEVFYGGLGVIFWDLCPEVLVGSRTDGAACSFDAQCVGGRCVNAGRHDCSGTCATRAPEGGSCDGMENSCVAGLRCLTSDGTTGVCTAGTPAKEGEPCGLFGCAEKLVCVNESATSSVCRARAPIGDACYQGQCEPNAHCDSTAAYTQGTCVAYLPVGSPCSRSASVPPVDFCESGTVCTYGAPGTTGSLKQCNPLSGLGGSCGEAAGCNGADLGCSADHQCVLLGVAGAACARASDCVWPLKCTGGTCAGLGTLGQACISTMPYACEPGLFCDWHSNTCVATGNVGDACTSAPATGWNNCAYALTCGRDPKTDAGAFCQACP